MSGASQSLSKVMELVSVAELSEDAAALARPDLQPLEFIQILMEKKLYPDAIRFLAHALPKREAVWWAWVNAKKASGATPPPKIKGALEATEKWISDPNEEHRRAAMAAGEIAEFSTAAGCAGLGAFFSGGSLAPPDAPTVPPGEFLTAKAVAGAIVIAAFAGDPKLAPEKFQAAVAQGVDITARIKLWEKA